MKKTILTIASALLVSTMLYAADAPKLSFEQIRHASITAENRGNFKSGRVVYAVTGKNIPKSFLMLRAKWYDRVRFDMLRGGEVFTAAQNKDSFWTWNKTDGVTVMSEDDEASFEEYIALLTVPFYDDPVFAEPVRVGEDENNKIKRDIYELSPLDGSDVSYRLWVEQKSKLVRKVEKTDQNGKISVTMYRDYKDYNGVKMPAAIFVSNAHGAFNMKLVRADWNLEIKDSIFDKNEKVIDQEIDNLLKSPLNPTVKEASEKMKKDQAKAEKLEKKISKLKLEIADSEKALEKMEALFNQNRQDATKLAGTTSHSASYSSYWNGYSWHSRRDHAADRDSRTRKKMVKEMGKENQKTLNEYKKLNKQLLQMRVELDEAERALDKLNAAME